MFPSPKNSTLVAGHISDICIFAVVHSLGEILCIDNFIKFSEYTKDGCSTDYPALHPSFVTVDSY